MPPKNQNQSKTASKNGEAKTEVKTEVKTDNKEKKPQNKDTQKTPETGRDNKQKETKPDSSQNKNNNKQNDQKTQNNKNSKQQPQKPQKEVPFILPEDRKAINDLKNKIELANKEVEKLSAALDSHFEKRYELQESERKEYGKMTYEAKKVSKVEDQKKEIAEQLASEDKVRKTHLDAANLVRRGIEEKWAQYFKQAFDTNSKAANLGKIDTRLKSLEQKISSTTMSLNDEKRIVSEINVMNQLKTLTKDFHQKMKDATDNYRKDNLEKRIKDLDDKVAKQKASETEHKEAIKKIQTELEELETEINDKVAKRKDCWKQIKEHEKGLEDISAKIDQQKEKWIKEREEERKRREEERERIRKEREAAREKRNLERAAKEAKTRPFDEEVRGCDKLSRELTTLLDAYNKLEEKAKTVASKKNIKFSVETLTLFELLSLAVHTKHDELEATIQSVKSKKEFYLELRKQLPAPAVDETQEAKEDDTDAAKEEEDDNKDDEQDEEDFSKVTAADIIGVTPTSENTEKTAENTTETTSDNSTNEDKKEEDAVQEN